MANIYILDEYEKDLIIIKINAANSVEELKDAMLYFLTFLSTEYTT